MGGSYQIPGTGLDQTNQSGGGGSDPFAAHTNVNNHFTVTQDVTGDVKASQAVTAQNGDVTAVEGNVRAFLDVSAGRDAVVIRDISSGRDISAVGDIAGGGDVSGLSGTFGAETVNLLNVVQRMRLNGYQLTIFSFGIFNTGGAVHHAIAADLHGAALSGFLTETINGASGAATPTPMVDGVTGFAAGAGIDAATPSRVLFDTADQTPGGSFIIPWMATVEQTVSIASPLYVAVTRSAINVNGAVLARPTMELSTNLGPFDVSAMPNATGFFVRFLGFVAL